MGRFLPTPFARLRNLLTLDGTRVFDTLGKDHAKRVLLSLPQPMEYPGFDGTELTGGQLRDLGHKMANALLAQGVTVNSRVVVVKQDHPDYLLYLYSAIAAGAVPVSVNAGTGWPYIAAVAKKAGARFVITDQPTLDAPGGAEHVGAMLDEGMSVLRVGPAPAPGTEHWWSGREGVTDFVPVVSGASAAAPPPRELGMDTPMALFHTSGTTGVPKLCIWSRRNVYRIWKLMMPTLPIGSRSRAMLAVPFSHQIAFALCTGVFLCGTRVTPAGLYDPKGALETIERERINYVMAFPHLYMRMSGEDLDAYDLSSMKMWSVGADKAHAAHIAKLIRYGSLKLPGRRAGSAFLDSYGSTEIGAGGILQVWLPGSSPEPCVQGKPMPTQYRLRIVDEQWRDVPAGQEGRILVDSTSYFDGYWDDHTRWAESRIDGWWWGGDIGRMDDKGRLLFLDREADSIRTEHGVLRTLPVEERLLSHPQAMEATVFQTGAGRAAAWVAPKGALTAADLKELYGGEHTALERELLALVNDGRPGPALDEVHVVPLEQIPMGVTGKVLKRRLREISEQAAQDGMDQSSRTGGESVEARIA